ncbi:DNA polymerase III subunit delta [Tepidamorphus sp. 3E244]|uniref:DNA polymerase III subunit delta n=1 Tax=Tepidamorphus sp. 3E244 TaxID=3385498 RepID=UPI0038FCBDC5
MVAIKAGNVDSFISRPDPALRLALVYGPDVGLVAERCQTLAEKLAEIHTGEIDRFDAETAPDIGTLFDAATSMSLFGGTQVIVVRPGAKQIGSTLEAILQQEQSAPIIVQGGDMKPSAPVRKLAESRENCVSLPCYVDGEQELARLVDNLCAEAGLTIEPDARQMLLQLLGGDRLATRGELEKLRNYCAGESTVTLEDVLAVCGDASALIVDDLVDAAALGEIGRADSALNRSLEAGTAVQQITGAFTRHYMQLRAARIAVENGATADTAVRSLRPPVFFKRQSAFKRQLMLWSSEAIDAALARIHAADAAARLSPGLEAELTGRMILGLGTSVARRRRA